jgi:hypothetical protein
VIRFRTEGGMAALSVGSGEIGRSFRSTGDSQGLKRC